MGIQKLLEIVNTDLPIEEKVRLHLSMNCYPPVPESLVPVSVLAIKLVSDGDGDSKISLPYGVKFREENEAPASAVVKNFHLDLFISGGEDDG
jgi:hypothetical protein